MYIFVLQSYPPTWVIPTGDSTSNAGLKRIQNSQRVNQQGNDVGETALVKKEEDICAEEQHANSR
jgi:hypothetical protein